MAVLSLRHNARLEPACQQARVSFRIASNTITRRLRSRTTICMSKNTTNEESVLRREDEVLRTISENGQVSVLVVDGTNLVREVRYGHESFLLIIV